MKFNNKPVLLVLLLVVLVRLLLLNVNLAEIGDSYNLLTAGEALKSLQYPLEEKRLPLLPLLLSLNRVIEPLLFGRLLMLVLSTLSIIITLKLYYHLSAGKNYGWFLVLLLATQPLWSYWSLRIMTDVLFALLFMLFVYLTMSKTPSPRLAIYLGVVTGLAAQTRFEGFLLLAAYLLFLFIKNKYRYLVYFLTPALLIVLPFFIRNWLHFGSLFYSSYAQEASQYLPDLRLIAIFITYLVFLMGPLTTWFVRLGVSQVARLKVTQILPTVIYLFLFMPLIGVWTAAVPRLFYSLVPLFALLVVLGFEQASGRGKEELKPSAVLFGLFLVLAWFLRVDFITGSFSAMVLVSFLSLLGLISLGLTANYRPWLMTVMLLSNLIVATSVISQAKDRASTTWQAVQYASKLPGLIGYADETGVSSWYLRKTGRYWRDDPGFTEALNWLRDNQIKYVLLTNEHYEEGAQFLVVYDRHDAHMFKLLTRFERVGDQDLFNQLFAKLGWKDAKQLIPKYAEVYEVISYRSPSD